MKSTILFCAALALGVALGVFGQSYFNRYEFHGQTIGVAGFIVRCDRRTGEVQWLRLQSGVQSQWQSVAAPELDLQPVKTFSFEEASKPLTQAK